MLGLRHVLAACGGGIQPSIQGLCFCFALCFVPVFFQFAFVPVLWINLTVQGIIKQRKNAYNILVYPQNILPRTLFLYAMLISPKHKVHITLVVWFRFPLCFVNCICTYSNAEEILPLKLGWSLWKLRKDK